MTQELDSAQLQELLRIAIAAADRLGHDVVAAHISLAVDTLAAVQASDAKARAR